MVMSFEIVKVATEKIIINLLSRVANLATLLLHLEYLDPSNDFSSTKKKQLVESKRAIFSAALGDFG